ncbi:MAG: hypothetical protein ACFFCS_11240 [Candidatus Hodarchaeota archaeon]
MLRRGCTCQGYGRGIQPAVLNRPSDSSAKGRKVNQALRTRSNVNRESVGKDWWRARVVGRQGVIFLFLLCFP